MNYISSSVSAIKYLEERKKMTDLISRKKIPVFKHAINTRYS